MQMQQQQWHLPLLAFNGCNILNSKRGHWHDRHLAVHSTTLCYSHLQPTVALPARHLHRRHVQQGCTAIITSSVHSHNEGVATATPSQWTCHPYTHSTPIVMAAASRAAAAAAQSPPASSKLLCTWLVPLRHVWRCCPIQGRAHVVAVTAPIMSCNRCGSRQKGKA